MIFILGKVVKLFEHGLDGYNYVTRSLLTRGTLLVPDGVPQCLCTGPLRPGVRDQDQQQAGSSGSQDFTGSSGIFYLREALVYLL
jgi:hypothetical protein